MSELEESHSLPDEFNGTVRVFPLPNLVVFPHIVQALHVFEPRYRELLEDARKEDCLIAMGLLATGWEPDYEGRPPIRDVLCLGRIISHTKLKDGKYNILLLGLHRAHLVRELPPERSFREAEVELLEDIYPKSGAAGRPSLRRRLMDCFRRILPKDPAARGQLEQLLGSQIPLGVLTDLVAYSLQIDLDEKQRLLDLLNVDQRAEILLQHLDQLLHKPARASSNGFPPEFSAN